MIFLRSNAIEIFSRLRTHASHFMGTKHDCHTMSTDVFTDPVSKCAIPEPILFDFLAGEGCVLCSI